MICTLVNRASGEVISRGLRANLLRQLALFRVVYRRHGLPFRPAIRPAELAPRRLRIA